MQQRSVVFRRTSDDVLVAPPTWGLLSVPDLIRHVQEWCDLGRPGPLVVDLSEVEDVDEMALKALLWARRQCATRGRRMSVVPPPPGVLSRQEELVLHNLNRRPDDRPTPAAPPAVISPQPT